MGHIFMTAVNAVFPIIGLILLGYILRRKNFLSDSFLKTGNRLVFQVCLPCMLFLNVYDISDFGVIRWNVVAYAVGMVLLLFVLGLASALAVTKVPERRGVLLQCVFRSNYAIIGLSLAAALGGEEALAVSAIVSAFTIPVFNILAVVALTMFVGKREKGSGGIAREILTNPLILGVALGLLALAVRGLEVRLWGREVFSLRRDVKFLYSMLTSLKSIASPLALIVLGGQFTFSAIGRLWKEIAVGTVWRIVLSPLLGLGAAALLSECTGWFSCGVNEFPALVALFGSPVAVSSAIMAGSMGSDEQLATQLVVWTSLGSIVTIFLEVCILMSAGLLAV